MYEFETLLVERRDNGVAIVTFQNPPVNGLGFAVRTELEAALERIAVLETAAAASVKCPSSFR